VYFSVDCDLLGNAEPSSNSSSEREIISQPWHQNESLNLSEVLRLHPSCSTTFEHLRGLVRLRLPLSRTRESNEIALFYHEDLLELQFSTDEPGPTKTCLNFSGCLAKGMLSQHEESRARGLRLSAMIHLDACLQFEEDRSLNCSGKIDVHVIEQHRASRQCTG